MSIGLSLFNSFEQTRSIADGVREQSEYIITLGTIYVLQCIRQILLVPCGLIVNELPEGFGIEIPLQEMEGKCWIVVGT